MGGLVDSVFYTAYALELVAVLVMIAAMVSFFTITLSERRGEIGLLLQIGAEPRQLLRIFLSEAAAIGVLGSTLGAFVGLLLSWRFVDGAMSMGTGLVVDFVVPIGSVVSVLCTAVVISVGAAFGPVLSSIRSFTHNGG